MNTVNRDWPGGVRIDTSAWEVSSSGVGSPGSSSSLFLRARFLPGRTTCLDSASWDICSLSSSSTTPVISLAVESRVLLPRSTGANPGCFEPEDDLLNGDISHNNGSGQKRAYGAAEGFIITGLPSLGG